MILDPRTLRPCFPPPHWTEIAAEVIAAVIAVALALMVWWLA